MLPNPYSPGEVPRVLVGRDRELARIATALDRVTRHGEMAGPPMVFTAPRGIGKTSLLRTAAARARPEGFAVAWVACVKGARVLPDLGSGVARALAEVGLGEQRAWLGRLESFRVEVGLPGVKASANFERPDKDGGGAGRGGEPAGRDGAGAPRGGEVTAVEDLLRSAARAVRERGGAGLVVFLDELHAPAVPDTGVLLNALQDLAGERQDVPLAVIGAGLPSTPGHLTKAATFGERSRFVVVPGLDEASADRALSGPAAELGVTWDEDALRLAGTAADGYPYFIQLLGSTTWDGAAPEQGRRITVEDVRRGLTDAASQIMQMFQARWEAATEYEQDFIEAMATHGDGPVARGEIARTLGRSTRAISVPRERLIDKGIIVPAGHGKLQFTIPGFAGYVRGHVSDAAADETPADGERWPLVLPEAAAGLGDTGSSGTTKGARDGNG